MKTLKSFVIVALLFLSASAAKAQFVKAEVQVSGLTCSMCQLATQKSLKTLDFISEIKPDLNRNVYVLTFKKDKPVKLDMIKKKVKDAGFSVSNLVAVFNFNDVAVKNSFQYNYGGDVYHFMNVGSKTLDGATRIRVLDKDFVAPAEYKKLSASAESPYFKTGLKGKTRVYHVTI